MSSHLSRLRTSSLSERRKEAKPTNSLNKFITTRQEIDFSTPKLNESPKKKGDKKKQRQRSQRQSDKASEVNHINCRQTEVESSQERGQNERCRQARKTARVSLLRDFISSALHSEGNGRRSAQSLDMALRPNLAFDDFSARTAKSETTRPYRGQGNNISLIIDREESRCVEQGA